MIMRNIYGFINKNFNPFVFLTFMNPTVLALLSVGLIFAGYIIYDNALPLPEDVDEVATSLKALSKEYKELDEAVGIALSNPDLDDDTVVEEMLEHSSIIEQKLESLELEKEDRLKRNRELESSQKWGFLAACGGAALVGLMTYFWH
jgi:hypothetical protein